MVRFTLSHNRLDMGGLADWLDRQERSMALPAKVAFAVRQCLEEAVANLIDHTPAADGDSIGVALDWQDDMLVATVEDSGPPFDLRAAPPMVRSASLETLVPGGWGIHLLRAFASDVTYETLQGRNHLTLRFAWPADHAASVTGGASRFSA